MDKVEIIRFKQKETGIDSVKVEDLHYAVAYREGIFLYSVTQNAWRQLIGGCDGWIAFDPSSNRLLVSKYDTISIFNTETKEFNEYPLHENIKYPPLVCVNSVWHILDHKGVKDTHWNRNDDTKQLQFIDSIPTQIKFSIKFILIYVAKKQSLLAFRANRQTKYGPRSASDIIRSYSLSTREWETLDIK